MLPLPLLCNISRHQKLVDTQTGPLRSIWVLWDNSFSTENRDTSSRPSHLQSFAIPQLFWSTEGFLYERFRCCEKKNTRRQIVILLPPSIYKVLPYHKNLKRRRVPLWNVSGLWENKKSTKNMMPFSLFPLTFLRTKSLPIHKRVHLQVVRYCDTKFFPPKFVIHAPSVIHNICRHQKCFETQKGSSTKFFGTVRQNFRPKVVILPSPLMQENIQ